MKIVFDYDDKKYTLEYTLRTASAAEKEGLNVFEIDQNPSTMIPILVNGAFQRHHRGMTRQQTDKIYIDGIRKKNDFIKTLVEMYLEAVSALVDTEEDEDEGNANWTKSD